MKRTITALLIALMAALSCEEITIEPPTPVQKTYTYQPEGFNGHFVEQMAKACAEYDRTGSLPRTMDVEGEQMDRSKYFSYCCALIPEINAHPSRWESIQVEFTPYYCPLTGDRFSYDGDSIGVKDLVLEIIPAIVKYADENYNFPEYCPIEKGHQEVGIRKAYDIDLSMNSIMLAFARMCEYYMVNCCLPSKVCIWDSDYRFSTNNCQIMDEDVRAVTQKAISGKETDMEKAKAIYDYVHDNIEYDYYYKSTKGAGEAIRQKTGNCCDISHAMVAMCRLAGIPARYMHAKIILNSKVEQDYVLPEVHVGGKWVLCDPTGRDNEFGDKYNYSDINEFLGRYDELPF